MNPISARKLKPWRALALLSASIGFAIPAQAELGPCKPLERTEVLICGEGNGAAIVIRDTTSPSGRLALAWRLSGAPPTEQPDGDIELLIIRLADGAVLAKSTTDYWDTGEMHVNRLQESAAWSPDSRFLVRMFDSRFSTDIVELYAIGADDAVTGPFDLLNLLNPATRARLKAKLKAKDTDNYAFSLSALKDGEKPFAIDDRGRIRAEVMLWVPKPGPFYYYRVRARVQRPKGALAARIESVVFRATQDKLD